MQQPPPPARTPGAPRSSLWRAGALVGGRYRLRAPIGAGAMGAVWRADHETLGTSVAVKLIDTANRDDAAETLARFRQEAWAAAQLKSPHVVQILDHGADGRVAFMVMELLEGESLEQRLERRGRLGPSEVVHVIRDVARGIDRAHAAGIVHRDLKPPNVFVARGDGVEIVKVLDFGIAKTMGPPRDVHLQTQQGYVVGTPAYMSPEQVLGKPVDHRSDLWQVALLAFECVTGERPFEGETLGQLFMAICTAPMPVPSRVGQVPPGFDAWFARAASRDPEQRFQSGAELAESLSAVLAPGGVGEGAIATLATSGRSDAWSTARVEPARRATPVALIAGLLLAPLSVLIVGGGMWLAARRPRIAAVAMTTATMGDPESVHQAPPIVSAPVSPIIPAPAATTSASAAATSSAKPRPPAVRAPVRGGAAKPPIDLGI